MEIPRGVVPAGTVVVFRFVTRLHRPGVCNLVRTHMYNCMTYPDINQNAVFTLGAQSRGWQRVGLTAVSVDTVIGNGAVWIHC